MHIAIDARFLGSPSYGLAQYSESLLESLARQDTENQYTVFVGPELERRPRVGENFTLVPVRGRPLSAGGLWRLRRELKRCEAEVLHVHFPLAPFFSDCPTLITVHDALPFVRISPRTRFPLWDRLGWYFLYPMTMRRSKWVVCVSRATRDRVVDIFPEVFHKTIVLVSGVDDVYREDVEPATADLVSSRLNTSGQYLLYSGSSGESKNIPRMIEAFALLRQGDARAEAHRFVLDLTGDLSGLGAIRRVVRQYGVEDRVHILTRMTLEERRVLFSRADALFIASRDEGFGFPVLQAQVSGVPVVAADSGALPEVTGEGGLLVDPDNLDELVDLVGQALFDTNLREYLIEKGRANAKRFSWDNTAHELRDIYELLFGTL